MRIATALGYPSRRLMHDQMTWDELLELRIFYSQEPFGQMVDDIQNAHGNYYLVAVNAGDKKSLRRIKLKHFLPEYCK